MSKKLYYDSAYINEWQTSVNQLLDREDGCYVILEETAFYPHGGGQPCDFGDIEGIPVLDVIAEEDEVLHRVERFPDAKNVTCRIDWNRRFDHMQQHSGQHLLSAVCRDLVQAMTVSFHLGSEYATIDVEQPDLSADQLASIEQETNRRIYENLGIVSIFVTSEQLAQFQLVKQPKVNENIRIVEIKGVEYNACGGTHVSSTGELGMIKLLKTEKMKGNTRIYFLCGYRALKEFQENQRILGLLAARFKTAKNEIIDRIEKWELEQKLLLAEIEELKAENDKFFVQELLAGCKGNMVAHVFADKPFKDVQSLASKLVAEGGIPALLAAAKESKVVLVSNGDCGFSCGSFFKEHLGGFGGKGGGSEKAAQAAFASWGDASAFYEFAKQHLTEKA